jgi:Na+/H+ antiporter NhaC
MEKILTAEEYAQETMQGADMDEITSALVGFASMHVGNFAAAIYTAFATGNKEVDMLLLLKIAKAYPSENIK